MTICGIQGALSGSADASCSQPTTAASTVTPERSRRNAGTVLVGGHADSGVVGVQPFAAH